MIPGRYNEVVLSAEQNAATPTVSGRDELLEKLDSRERVQTAIALLISEYEQEAHLHVTQVKWNSESKTLDIEAVPDPISAPK